MNSKLVLQRFYVAFALLFAINSRAQEAINTITTSDIKVEIKPLKNTASEDPWIVLGGLAYHSCRTCGFREDNPGLALQWRADWLADLTGLDSTRLTAGVYINSNNRNSVYAGAQWLPYEAGLIKFGVQGVIITGYKEAVLTPVLLPLVTVETKHVGVDLYAVPKMAKVSAAVFATFKLRF